MAYTIGLDYGTKINKHYYRKHDENTCYGQKKD